MGDPLEKQELGVLILISGVGLSPPNPIPGCGVSEVVSAPRC